jgi:hypothetical protein
MNSLSDTVEPGRGRRLPAWLRPRAIEMPGSGRTRLIETTLLLLAALLLAIATVNDVVLQTKVNHRLVADLATWRSYTGLHYHNLTVEQDFHGHTNHEVVCGNTTPGPPGQRVQLCLLMAGPVVRGYRMVRAGWHLPPKTRNLARNRYGCFGPPTPGWPCTR